MQVCLRIIAGVTLVLASGMLSVAVPSTFQGNPLCGGDITFYFGENLVVACVAGGQGLFRSTNEGWQMIFPRSGWHEVKAAPGGTIYLYDLFESHLVLRSTDYGKKWAVMGKAPFVYEGGGTDHIFPSPMPDVVFLGVWDYPFDPRGKGIYRSTDGGATWERVLANGNGNWVDFSPDFAQDGIAFAAIADYHTSLGVWKTTDWGETWFPVNTGLYTGTMPWGVLWVAVSPQFPLDQTAFTTDSTGLYKTTNGGQSWFLLEETVCPLRMVLSPDYIHDQTLMSMDGIQLSLSQDGGRSWQVIRSNEDMIATGITRMNNDPNILEFWVVSGPQMSGTYYLYRSRDYGATWENVPIYSQLSTAKYINPDLALAGDPLTCTLHVTNTGTVLLNATVTDTLPLHITPGKTASGSLVLPGGTLTWRPVITGPGGVWTQTLVVTTEAGYAGPITNVLRVSSVERATSVYTKTITVCKPWIYLPIIQR